MKKDRPTADKLANELMGASAFFRQSARPEPTPADPSATPPSVSPQPPSPTPTPDVPADSDVMTSRRHAAMTSAPSSISEGFDLNRPTASRDSLRLSMDETKALDELRNSLKWDHDVMVSKNDIRRVALHQLLEEFAAKGERSEALKRLKRKTSSR